MNNDNKNLVPETLATELIREMKNTAKRWFIAFVLVLGLWFGTIFMFIWYVSLPNDGYEIEQLSTQDSRNSIIGGDYNASLPTDTSLSQIETE